MREILDRALGRAPQHVDISALRHTEIVYRSAAEIRKALIEQGAPVALLDLKVEEIVEEKAEENTHKAAGVRERAARHFATCPNIRRT